LSVVTEDSSESARTRLNITTGMLKAQHSSVMWELSSTEALMMPS
jgi:hypothetical protein